MKKAYQVLLKSIAISVFAILPLLFYGQDNGEEESGSKQSSFSPYWYLKVSGGAAFGHTDLNRYKWQPDFENIGFGGQLGFGRQFTPVFGFGGYAHIGSISGIENEGKFNREYESDYLEFAFRAPINFSNLFGGYKDRAFNIWGSVGYGQIQYKTDVYDLAGNKTQTLGYDEADGNVPNVAGDGLGSRRVVAILPVGVGFSYAIAEKWDLNLDWTFKFADSDIVDGVNGGAKAVKQDMLSFYSLGLTYKFGFGAGLKGMLKDYEMVTFTTTPKVLKEKGDEVEVTIEGKIPPKYMGKNTAMYFQPVLKYDGGQTELKPITLKGEDVMGDGIVINSKTGGTFTYTDTFDYTPEMKKSTLVVNPVAYEVKESVFANKDEIVVKAKYVELGERELAKGVIYTSERIYPGDADMLAAFHGYEKETIISEDAKVFFRVNRYYLNWRYPLNEEEATLNKLEEMWDFAKRGWEIKSVEIDGWASPEGEETFNENLSENRSESAYDYMISKFKRISRGNDAPVDYSNPEEQLTFNMQHHGPDWAGFMSSVEKSDLEDKNVILNVIRSAASQEKKEQEIRNMILIYPEIEDEILKPLRRAELAIHSYEPKRTDENIAELSTTYPDSLKVEELLYAATLTEDDDTKLVIYESAIEVYPDSWKGYNNAGVMELKQGNLDQAMEYFQKAIDRGPHNGEIYNNMGVAALHQEDYEKAAKMFQEAENFGKDTHYNMGLVAIENGEYDKATRMLGTKDCDYNAGLAYLVAENYNKAESTLKCTKENLAESYYLLAIVGARTDNKDMMFEYLTKAIQADSKYKEQASYDREFLDYMNEPDFQALVN